MRVHHIALVTAELQRAERFYVEVLGLPVTQRHQDDRGAPRAVWLALGDGAFLALEKGDPTSAPRADASRGLHCLALAITPSTRETWRARLEAHAVPIEKESAYTLYVRDPDGVLVGLSHHPTPA